MVLLRVIFKIAIILLIFSIFSGCKKQGSKKKDGQASAGDYFNPILPGFYPDPSICKAGADYFIVTSTFAFYPGVPIFKSRDLVNWQQIGHVLDRPGQLNLNGLDISEGIFAPTIRYNDGTFYMITTLVGGVGNFLVTAQKPEGPWSDPVWLPDVTGIDPSFFFDDNGRAYVVFNSEPPGNISLYDGHRAIWMYEFDADKKETFGEKYLLVNGGTDITKKPIWIEGPHIFKTYGYYYLIAAEGGTGINHSEVVFRSENVTGPYTSYNGNPVLTQRHLDINRKNPVTNTGHADLVQIPNGGWWAVFLGCRPYENNFFNTGRETFLLPVNWANGWPVINHDKDTVLFSYPCPPLEEHKWDNSLPTGNFRIMDEFDKDELDYSWMFIRTVRDKWYSLHVSPGNLRISLRPEVIWGRNNPSFIGRRQQHTHCHACAALDFTPRFEYETAGIIAYQNGNFYYLGKTLKEGNEIIQVLRGTAPIFLRTGVSADAGRQITGGYQPEVLREVVLDKKESGRLLYLKIEASGQGYSFLYSTVVGKWKTLLEGADRKYLSTEVAGGFVGTILGMYASSNSKHSDNYADYCWFEYEGNDPVYE